MLEAKEGLWRPDYDARTGKHHLVQQEEVKEAESQLSISQLQTTQDRLEQAESIIPLVIVDLKGKAPETPSNEPKKRKLVKTSEGEPKKKKLMPSAISTAKTIEVYY